jgi:hypothetical protein
MKLIATAKMTYLSLKQTGYTVTAVKSADSPEKNYAATQLRTRTDEATQILCS